MAKNSQAEETELKISENLPLCTAPQTVPTHPLQKSASRPPESSDPTVSENMERNSQKEGTEPNVSENVLPHKSSFGSPECSDPAVSEAFERRIDSGISPEKSDPVAPARGLKRPREVTRCAGSSCRKRIGLFGFRCRCGEVFCSEHRYSDRHNCGYDYKAAGREAIARENPVVRAAKLLKV